VTLAHVTAWREELFDHRSLRTTVEALSDWPLSQYLWAAVLQAAHLDRLRQQTQQQDWQTPAWDFGRLAKAHPLLFNLDSLSGTSNRQSFGDSLTPIRTSVRCSLRCPTPQQHPILPAMESGIKQAGHLRSTA
jgi:hypothetical protein